MDKVKVLKYIFLEAIGWVLLLAVSFLIYNGFTGWVLPIAWIVGLFLVVFTFNKARL